MEAEYDFKAGTYQIAKHEAGHWLCANYHGWSPRDIQIRVPAAPNYHFGSAATSHRVQLKSTDDVRFYASVRVKTLYSGAYAQHYDGVRFHKDLIYKELMRGGGANSDFLKAEELYFFYYNCLSAPSGWEEEFEKLQSDIQRMIADNFDFITAVSEKFSAMANHVDQILQLDRPDLLKVYNARKRA